MKKLKPSKKKKKENCDEDKILRDLGFIFDPEKDHYEPKKLLMPLIIIIWNMNIYEVKTKY